MEKISLVVQNEGDAYCKSNFYSVHDILVGEKRYTFTPGINKMIGEIDSGNWAISYLLSMYKYRSEDFILFEKPQVIFNNKIVSLNEINDISIYIDKSNPLFSANDSIKNMVIKGLRCSKIDYSENDIRDLFQIDNMRFERPLTSAGNEIFKAMVAIGFSYKKDIFCFPWLSNKRYEGFHQHLEILLKIMENLNKIIIFPIGKP